MRRFARDGDVMRRVGCALLGSEALRSGPSLSRWIVATDAFDESPQAAPALFAAVSRGSVAMRSAFGPPSEVRLTTVRAGARATRR